MRAGRRRHRLVLEAETRESNGQGGYTTVWAAVGKPIRAEVIGLSGDEAISAAVTRSVQQWRITFLKRPGVTTKHRLREGAVLYDIKSVMEDPRDAQALVLICETGATH